MMLIASEARQAILLLLLGFPRSEPYSWLNRRCELCFFGDISVVACSGAVSASQKSQKREV